MTAAARQTRTPSLNPLFHSGRKWLGPSSNSVGPQAGTVSTPAVFREKDDLHWPSRGPRECQGANICSWAMLESTLGIFPNEIKKP